MNDDSVETSALGCSLRSTWSPISPSAFQRSSPDPRPIHFKEETISLCHPERSEGSLSGERSFAPLRMTILNRLRLTRKTSYLKWIEPCGHRLSEGFDRRSRRLSTTWSGWL